MNATSTMQAAADTVTEYVRTFQREWRVMAKDPLFAFYGGVDSEKRRTAYIARRLQAIRTGCTPYLHRPEYMALAEALENVLA